MPTYIVKGEIQNYDKSKFYVEILDNDQHWFDDRVDDLLGSSWTDDYGKFEIQFDDSLYKDNWFEGKPELFLIVRDKFGKILYKTNTKSPSNSDDIKNLTFEIVIPKERSIVDSPYDIANSVRMSAFARIGDTIDTTDNVVNSSRLLMQSLNAWFLYTNETKWDIIGYDGPQVERYPWREDHTHKLKWNNG
ncbi:MAG: hypothetical protein OEL84_06130 [Nitrosopumilus sp.]|nr:hypothetical protein [Nitrosopumilus sp.]